MIFKRLRSLFSSKNPIAVKPSSTEALGTSTISFWTAGIKFDNRLEHVLQCQLKEPVTLLREPNNAIDTNAIHIKTQNNESLGYVGQYRAAKLAPLLDNNQLNQTAYITELKCDLASKIYGVKVTLPLSNEVLKRFKTDQEKEIDFVFDTSSRDNLYLLVDCEEAILPEIRNIIETLHITIHRAGLSYAPSSDGKQYKWYFRLDNNSDKNSIEQALRQKYPLLEEKYNDKINEEYLELQDETLSALEASNHGLSKEVDQLNSRLENYIKRERSAASQFETMLSIFLNTVVFLGDSLDVLQEELKDYKIALSKISEIQDTVNYKAKKIQTLDKWFEIHYNTGQKDDGRIYFKKENRQMQVLVSFKSSQKKDIAYLKKVPN